MALPGWRRAAAVLGLLALAACTEAPYRSDLQPGQAAGPGVLSPASPSLEVGWSVRFAAAGFPAADLEWRVEPPGAGTFPAPGLFQAASAGTCTVLALQRQPAGGVFQTPVRIYASTPGTVSSDSVQAKGSRQATVSGSATVDCTVLEVYASQISTDPSGRIVNRSGFAPTAR
jgi:hypothetical protein